MTWNDIDWPALERLRAAFLAGQRDYWQSERDLASYDLTFAARIGWKWDHVLRELRGMGWTPPAGTVLDFGCGTGIAARKFGEYFGSRQFALWDQSPLALRYAQAQIPGAIVGQSGDVLLLSHVVNELDDWGLDELCALAGKASVVLAVEPGTYESSHRLIELRERLRQEFQVIAPCVHRGVCGMAGSRHWCHHFATPPREVVRDGNWARFAKLAGVDLRSLPVSYLVLDKRPFRVPGNVRVIGRPRLHKGYALVLGCDAEGVREARLTQRKWPAVYRQARKGELAGRQWWRCAGTEIVEIKTP
jgi:SAM-dependent methyltransferase